jgi:hypothetical protein
MAKKEEYDFSEYADMKLPPKKEIKEPLAEEFDFSEYADNKNEIDKEALMGGASDVATLGLLPQVTAMSEPLISRGLNLVRKEQIPEAPFKQMVPGSPEFIKARDEYRGQLEEIKQRSPKSFAAGQIGGAIATSPLIPVGKATGLLGGVGQAAKGGAIVGALQNPGDIEGDASDLQLKERAKGALTGGALGAASGLLAKGVTEGVKAIKNAPKAIDELAKNKAFKASGAMLKDFRKAFDKGKVNELGQEMFDSGLVTAGSTFDDVAAKTSVIKKDVGSKIGEIYNSVSDKMKLNPISKDNAINELIDASSSSKIRPTIGKDAYDTKMLSVIEDISKQNDVFDNPKVMNELIGEIDQKINYAKKTQDLPEIQQGLLAIRNKLREQLTSRVDEIGNELNNTNLKKELLDLNKRYSRISELNAISSDRVARESANRAFGLTDTIVASGVGGAGAMEGYRQDGVTGALKGLALGAAAGLANKGARQYGSPLLAQGLLKTGQKLAQTPETVSNVAQAAANVASKSQPKLGSLSQLISDRNKARKK